MADDDLIQKTSQQPKTTLRRGVFSLDWHYFSLNDTGVRLIGCFSWQVGMKKHVDPPLHSCCMMLQSVSLSTPGCSSEPGGGWWTPACRQDKQWWEMVQRGGRTAAIREWKEDATMKELDNFQEHVPSNDLMALLKLCPNLWMSRAFLDGAAFSSGLMSLIT